MAIISPNMALAVWNLVSDRFNHEQMADNLMKLDYHDHSPGRGIQIPTEGLMDGAVTAVKLAPGANAVQDGSIIPSKFGTLPAAKVYNSAVTLATNGSETTLGFDSERFDTDNLHDTSVNNSRFTVNNAGVYALTASIESSAAPTTGVLRLGIYKNGTVNALARSSMVANAVSHTLTTFARLAVGDYVIARVLNTTGANLNIALGSPTSEGINDFGIMWMAP